MRQSPTGRRRRLGRELCKLREEAGLTGKQAAAQTGLQQSQITHLELGQVKYPKPEQILRLLKEYGVTDRSQLETILSWAEQTKSKPYWGKYAGLTAHHEMYLGLEEEAKVLRVYEPLVIPGLLQTEAYTRALIVGRIPGATDTFIDNRVKLRAERQQRLLYGDDPLKKLKVIIAEEAFLRPVGGRDTMVEQLEHLKKMNSHDLIELYVVPLSNGVTALAAPFTVITFWHDLDQEAVYMETPAGELWCEGQGVQNYEAVFETLIDSAVAAVDTVGVIDAAIQRLACQPAEIGSRRYGWVDLAKVPPQ